VEAGLETNGDEERRNTTAAPNVNDSARTASKEEGPTTLWETAVVRRDSPPVLGWNPPPPITPQYYCKNVLG